MVLQVEVLPGKQGHFLDSLIPHQPVHITSRSSLFTSTEPSSLLHVIEPYLSNLACHLRTDVWTTTTQILHITNKQHYFTTPIIPEEHCPQTRSVSFQSTRHGLVVGAIGIRYRALCHRWVISSFMVCTNNLAGHSCSNRTRQHGLSTSTSYHVPGSWPTPPQRPSSPLSSSTGRP